MTTIYLDYAATCPVDPRVVRAMEPMWSCGNAASGHGAGKAAARKIEEARQVIANGLGAKLDEVIFTSGATESDNLALKGYAEAHPDPTIVTVKTEHKAILNSAEYLQKRGVPVHLLSVGSDGLIDLRELWSVIRPGALVSVMAVNNETGVVQPLQQIGAICRARQAYFHCDAAQGFGKIPLDVNELDVDMLSLSAHKIYGPKGIGALYLRETMPLEPQMHGGSQEQGVRAGTANGPLAVGFAEAARLILEDMDQEQERLRGLRHMIIERVRLRCPDFSINGEGIPNILNLGFRGRDNDDLLDRAYTNVMCSAGSACSLDGPSYVLKAMGREGAALRLSLGRWTTQDKAALAADHISRCVLTCNAA